MNNPDEADFLHSPHFLSVLSDLCHVQNAALLRRLEEDIKSSVQASHMQREQGEGRTSR